MVGAIVVLAYYAAPLTKAAQEHKYTDGKFVSIGSRDSTPRFDRSLGIRDCSWLSILRNCFTTFRYTTGQSKQGGRCSLLLGGSARRLMDRAVHYLSRVLQ